MENKNDDYGRVEQEDYKVRKNYYELFKMRTDNFNSLMDILIKLFLAVSIVFITALISIPIINSIENENKYNTDFNINLKNCKIMNYSIKEIDININTDLNTFNNKLSDYNTDFIENCDLNRISINVTKK